MNIGTDRIGFGLRFVANIVDCVIILLISIILSRILILLPVSLWGFIAINFLVLTITTLVYEGLMTSKYGWTLGKYLVQCKVVDEQGNKISLKTSIIRFFSKFLSALLLGIGYLMILWDKEKQGLHDKIANTYVTSDTKNKLNKKIKGATIIIAVLITIAYLAYVSSAAIAGFLAGVHPLSTSNPITDIAERCSEKAYIFSDLCLAMYGKSKTLYEQNATTRLEICSQISINSLQMQCVNGVAVHLRQRDVCNNAQSGYHIRYCEKMYDSLTAFAQYWPSPNERKNTRETIDSIPEDFDTMFTSFQKVNNKIKSVHYDSDLSAPSNVAAAKDSLKEMNGEIENARTSLQKINESIALLKVLKFDEKSKEKLNQLERTHQKYVKALDKLEQAHDGSSVYLDFRGYEVQIWLILDKFLSHNDLANDYIDEEKFEKAKAEIIKAITLNDEMFAIRKTEYSRRSTYQMEILERLYNEDVLYQQFITEKKKEIERLITSPNTPKSQRFAKSDEIYDKYNEVYVEEGEYNEYMSSWMDKNVDIYWTEASDILTEADIEYNALMRDYTFYWD